MLHDSTYIKYRGQACLQRQISDWGLPGALGDGRPRVVAKGCRVSFRGWWKCSKIDCSHRLHLSRLRDTELYMLSGWILWYVNYISIALKKKSNPMQDPDNLLNSLVWMYVFYTICVPPCFYNILKMKRKEGNAYISPGFYNTLSAQVILKSMK